MSEENVETLHQALDAFNRRDKAAWLATCDPELENVPASEWPENARIRGAEAIWDFYVEAVEAWEALVRRLLWPVVIPDGQLEEVIEGARAVQAEDARSREDIQRGQLPRKRRCVGAGPVSLAFLLGL